MAVNNTPENDHDEIQCLFKKKKKTIVILN